MASLPKRAALAVAVAALVGALMLPSTAPAASRHTSVQAAITKTDRSQNALIKRTRRSLAAVSRSLSALTASNKAGDKSL